MAPKVDCVLLGLAFDNRDLKVVFQENRKNFLKISIMLFHIFRENKYIIDLHKKLHPRPINILSIITEKISCSFEDQIV